MFQVMLLGRSADKAYNLMKPLEPFVPFRDPSRGPSCFDLSVLHCIRVKLSDPILSLSPMYLGTQF